jgi:hypothetical protein
MPARRPEECDTILVDAINKGDLEAAIALYEPSARFVQESGEVVTCLFSKLSPHGLVVSNAWRVLERSQTHRPCFRRFDRLFWILLSRWWPQWREPGDRPAGDRVALAPE